MRQKIIPILIILFGFALLSYPFISNYMFEKSAGSTIKSYEKQAKTYDQKQKEQAFRKAEEYNKDLIKSVVQLTDPFKVKKSNGETLIYNNILNIDHSGVMGYLEIPEIRLKLPIYHGTGDFAICNGAGHVEGSSFPIGGKGTHAVLSSHRGLPGAKLFSDLDKLKVGDYFTITVLRQTIFYQIDRIDIVEPEETGLLALDKEKDYCTLLTCTPYGINTKRLLVRGVRCEVTERAEPIRTGEKTYRRWYAAIGLNVFVAGVILCWKRKKKEEDKYK